MGQQAVMGGVMGGVIGQQQEAVGGVALPARPMSPFAAAAAQQAVGQRLQATLPQPAVLRHQAAQQAAQQAARQILSNQMAGRKRAREEALCLASRAASNAAQQGQQMGCQQLLAGIMKGMLPGSKVSLVIEAPK